MDERLRKLLHELGRDIKDKHPYVYNDNTIKELLDELYEAMEKDMYPSAVIDEPHDIPNTNEIAHYMHCALCLEELPRGKSPQEYARIQAGLTKWGIQVWCNRHDCNVAHIDFEGKSPFPANTDRSK